MDDSDKSKAKRQVDDQVDDDNDDDKKANVSGEPKLYIAVSQYRDWSHIPPERPSEIDVNNRKDQSKEPTFPVKLHGILSNPEYETIISFLPHGRSWRIHDQKRFEDEILPKYFRHGRFSSFTRQVNGWGFQRISTGTDFNSYFHELFLRGMPHLCLKMRRLTTRDMTERRQKKQEGYVETPPDFYAMDRTNPLPRSNESFNSKNDDQKQSSSRSEALGYSAAAAAVAASADRTIEIPRLPLAAASLDSNDADVQQELTQLRILHQEIVKRINEISQRGQDTQRPALQFPQSVSASNDMSDLAGRALANLLSSGQVQPQQLLSAISALGLVNSQNSSASSSTVQHRLPDLSASNLHQLARNISNANLPSPNNLPIGHHQQQLMPSALDDSNPLLAQLLHAKLLQQQVQPTLQQEQQQQQQQQMVNVFGNVLAAFLAQQNSQHENK